LTRQGEKYTETQENNGYLLRSEILPAAEKIHAMLRIAGMAILNPREYLYARMAISKQVIRSPNAFWQEVEIGKIMAIQNP
jgi:hypothetical protein